MKYWFIFSKTDIALQVLDDGTYSIPLSDTCPIETHPWTRMMEIDAMEDGKQAIAVRVNDPHEIESLSRESANIRLEFCPLRQSYYKLPSSLYLKAGKCQELLYWDANTQFCGVCGAPMKMHTIISKRCTNCGKEVWPQLATAIIVLVHKEDEVLLVHARNFHHDFYGLVAGFVETGETLEHAVHREVKEETGLEIKNLKYFGSQPWPYPCGIMVGYNADYVSGDIHLQKEELSKGNWFRKDNLPNIPEKLSIARMIIDDWINDGPGHLEELDVK